MTYETIRYGSSGQNVRKLQTMLKKQGYDLAVDGQFGPKTRRAVTQYQQTRRLPSDGIVGKNTWNALTAGNTAPTAAEDTLSGQDRAQWGSPVTRTPITTTAANQSSPIAQTTTDYTPSQEVISAEEALEELEDSRPGEYESQYTDELERLYDQILGRPDFSYDLGADPMYQQYRQQYMTQGRLAMEDTMGAAAGLTGGYGSSYSQNAGQQAYGRYLQGLNDTVPQLYALALDRYGAQGQALEDRYAMVYDLEQRDRDRYADDYDRWFREYSRAQDALEDIREEDYERYLDMLEAQEKAAGKSGSSGGGTKKSGSSSGGKKSSGMSDFAIRELAWLYMDAGNDAHYQSQSMLQWMRSQGIEADMDEQFYAALRELGYAPSRGSSGGGGGKNIETRDHRFN